MLKLTEEQLDWLAERIPDHELSPKGGRPPADKRKVMQGIFWILDSGAKWKDLPRRFGSKSTVHRRFQIWTHAGVFEQIMVSVERTALRLSAAELAVRVAMGMTVRAGWPPFSSSGPATTRRPG